MGAVEDGDPAAPRRMWMHAPQEIVVLLLRSRLLEALHLHPLGVHGPDHVPAGAVLAGAVDALQHDQQRVLTLPVKGALKFGDLVEMALQLLGGFRVIGVLAMKAGVDLSEIDLRAGVDTKSLGVIHDGLHCRSAGLLVATKVRPPGPCGQAVIWSK